MPMEASPASAAVPRARRRLRGALRTCRPDLSGRGRGLALATSAFPASPGRPWASSAAPAAGKSSLGEPDSPLLRRHRQGAVLVDGRGCAGATPVASCASGSAWCRSRRCCFPAPSGRTCCWGNPNATDEDLWQALETAQAAGLCGASQARRPGRAGGPGGHATLSGGQRQRLTIARALGAQAGNPHPGRQRQRPGLRHRRRAAPSHPRRWTGRLTVFIVSQRASFHPARRHAFMVLDDGEAGGPRHPRASCWKPARSTGRSTCPSTQRKEAACDEEPT